MFQYDQRVQEKDKVEGNKDNLEGRNEVSNELIPLRYQISWQGEAKKSKPKKAKKQEVQVQKASTQKTLKRQLVLDDEEEEEHNGAQLTRKKTNRLSPPIPDECLEN